MHDLQRIVRLMSLAAIAALVGCAGNGKVATSRFPTDTRVAKLRVNGLSCPLCAHNIDLKLMEVPGVRGVHVDLGAGVVTIAVADGNAPTEKQIAKAIDASGFTLINLDMQDGASKMICNSCSCKTCSCVLAGSRCGPACACRS